MKRRKSTTKHIAITTFSVLALANAFTAGYMQAHGHIWQMWLNAGCGALCIWMACVWAGIEEETEIG